MDGMDDRPRGPLPYILCNFFLGWLVKGRQVKEEEEQDEEGGLHQKYRS